ncbi:MAG: CaiB/BaiF CoA-transferase family protein [Proteobacteria bacterium]|nr:CaiB/BaiF CoA-transferase family protein [Pseudomonadota bacterium]
MSDPNYPLHGLKVLDFSRVLAGPFAGRMMSDLGADVVKVEPPDNDITRLWGKVIAGIPGYYHQQNAGKRNICIDLRADGARNFVHELVKKADILLENYRPDVMGRLGLDYATLNAINPRLIMLSISGFGSNGPESWRPAYAPVIHAEAGLIDRAARRGGLPPRDMPVSISDTNASLHGLIGVLSAVIMRERTGVGQHIEISMIDATVATDDQLQYDLEGSEHTGPLPNQIWDTPIGPILISTDVRWLWRLLHTELGVADPTTKNMDFDTKVAARHQAITDFLQTLATREKIDEAMTKMNLAWGQVRTAASIRDQPTIAARGAITDIDDRAGGTRPITQSPYRFSTATSGVRGPAPHRGEHNTQVLKEWLNYPPETILALQTNGILHQSEEASTTN